MGGATMRRLNTLCLAICAIGASACAARKGHGPASTPSPPPMLFDNLGTHHHAVTTGSPEAQRYFDQGLRLIWAFNHDEATRAFQEAVRLDPECAMGWWGIALA